MSDSFPNPGIISELPALREAKAASRRAYLEANPSEQARAIARHYKGLADVARHLCLLTDAVTDRPQDKPMRELIETLVETIKEEHLLDLGLPMKWETPDEWRPGKKA